MDEVDGLRFPAREARGDDGRLNMLLERRASEGLLFCCEEGRGIRLFIEFFTEFLSLDCL
jgi:hypothetical protein